MIERATVPKENRAHQDSFEQQRDTWRRAYAEAPSVRERFPQLERLTIDIRFCDVKRLGTYSPQMRGFGASAKAFFAFECPRTLCLQGGFDLDPIVQGLFTSNQAKSSGKLQCQGRLHSPHNDNAHCRLELHYAIHLVYEVSESTTVGRPGARSGKRSGN